MDGKQGAADRRKHNRARQMEELVQQHEGSLLRYATRLLGNVPEAQDVVQNAFVKLYRNWKKGMQPSLRLKAWLYRVTHNEAIDLMRRTTRLSDLHERHAQDTVCADGHNCPDNPNERIELVMAHVHKLAPAERQVLLLRLEEGLSYNEIGTVTGRTTGNVGCLLHNAVKKLSKVLQGFI